MFRFIQCGDLHLGAPFLSMPSLGRYIDEALRSATYRSFENVVTYGINEAVDAFLITGDIYNSEYHDLEAQVRFLREMERLAQANIPVFIVQGNHDPSESWAAGLTLPPNVYIFSSERPERRSLIVRDKEVAGIYGMSCSQYTTSENVAAKLQPIGTDQYAIAMFHGTVTGAQGVNKITCPCSEEDLVRAGFDYWAIGHIHKREILRRDPMIVYAGNTQGLNRKEIGPKGCYLVQIGGTGEATMHFEDCSVIRFAKHRIDISDMQTVQDIEDEFRRIRETYRRTKRAYLLTIVFEGQGPMHAVCSREESYKLWREAACTAEAYNKYFVVPFRFIDESRGDVDLAARRCLGDMAGDYLRAYDALAGNLGETLADSAQAAHGADLSAAQAGGTQGANMVDHSDAQAGAAQGTKLAHLRAILLARPEAKRLGRFQEYLSDELIMRALQRAEREGVLTLLQEDA